MTMTKKVAVVAQTDSADQAERRQVQYEPGDIRPEELDTEECQDAKELNHKSVVFVDEPEILNTEEQIEDNEFQKELQKSIMSITHSSPLQIADSETRKKDQEILDQINGQGKQSLQEAFLEFKRKRMQERKLIQQSAVPMHRHAQEKL